MSTRGRSCEPHGVRAPAGRCVQAHRPASCESDQARLSEFSHNMVRLLHAALLCRPIGRQVWMEAAAAGAAGCSGGMDGRVVTRVEASRRSRSSREVRSANVPAWSPPCPFRPVARTGVARRFDDTVGRGARARPIAPTFLGSLLLLQHDAPETSWRYHPVPFVEPLSARPVRMTVESTLVPPSHPLHAV
jgi:hypothetical protein